MIIFLQIKSKNICKCMYLYIFLEFILKSATEEFVRPPTICHKHLWLPMICHKHLD